MALPEIIHADSFDYLRNFDDQPFDAIVTDPPYGLSFMGKAWDNFGTPLGYQQWSQAWAELALGVVKPGAHMVAFGAPRLYHRMAVGIEDAGWEVRDCLVYCFGSGFPKSLNLEGGYGTALKPAYEPIILARAPLSGTVQATFDEHGTGAMHIDAARIPLNGDAIEVVQGVGERSAEWGMQRSEFTSHDAGRWPANIALDESAGAMLDAEFDAVTGSPIEPISRSEKGNLCGNGLASFTPQNTSDNQSVRAAAERGATGPSRFFYTSKASRAEREQGLNGEPIRRSDGRAKDIEHPRLRTNARRNHHPSVKPIDLMRWLCRLIVPAGGRILDPFAGSGSTLIAAHLEGMTAVGIERDDDYADIARGRIADWCAQQVMALE